MSESEVAEVLEALTSDARTRVANVRDGLRSILKVLSSAPGTVVVVDDFTLTASAPGSRSAVTRSKPRVVSKPVTRSKSTSKTKRGRASA